MLQLEKSLCSNEDPAQSKINNLKKKKKKKKAQAKLRIVFYLEDKTEDVSLRHCISDSSEKLLQRGRREDQYCI